MSQRTQTVPIALWFTRHTLRPLMAATALFGIAMALMVTFIASSEDKQQEESAGHIVRMAELATIQKNRPLLESLADLGHKDIGLEALAICEGKHALFLYPDGLVDCDLPHSFWQSSLQQGFTGRRGVNIKMTFPKFPGYNLALLAVLIGLAFAVTSVLIYRRMGRRLRDEILQPLLAGVVDEGKIAAIRKSLRIAELDHIFGAYEKKLADLRSLADENARNAEAAAIARTTQSLAHDIKNPLITFDFVLRLESWDQFLSMRGQITRSLAAIRGILAGIATRSTAQLIAPRVMELDLKTAVDDMAHLVAPRGVKVAFHGPSPITLNADGDAVERGIRNLIKNAQEAGATSVEVSTAIEDRQLVISVADNGPGVPSVLLNRLFERGATHAKAEGEGLGLHNVKLMSEAHGGTVAHRRHNDRTVFVIYLPMEAPPANSLVEVGASCPGFHAIPSQDPTGVLVALPDPQRQAELVDALRNAGLPAVTADVAASPLLIVADFDHTAESLDNSKARIVFDEPQKPVDKVVRTISRLYASLLRAQTGAEPI